MGQHPRGRWDCVDQAGSHLSANFANAVQGVIDGVTYTANPADSTTWGVKRIPRNKGENNCYVCIICNKQFKPREEGPRAMVDHWTRTHCLPGLTYKCPSDRCTYNSYKVHNIARHTLGDKQYSGQLDCRLRIALLPASSVENWAKDIHARAMKRFLNDLEEALRDGKMTVEEFQRDYLGAVSSSTY